MTRIVQFSFFLMALAVTTAQATILESWQFNEAAGTQFSGLVNDVGAAAFSGNKPQVATDGLGALQFTQGTGTQPDNVFRDAVLTNKDRSTGIFELEFTILAANLSGGDAEGANVGFGMREETGTDLFVVRLHKLSNTLRLQTRIGNVNTNLANFGASPLSAPLKVRAVADLDADLLDVYYTLGSGAEQSALDIAIPNLEFDIVRLIANTNSTDWGASDTATADYLKLSGPEVPEPASLALCVASLGLVLVGHRRVAMP